MRSTLTRAYRVLADCVALSGDLLSFGMLASGAVSSIRLARKAGSSAFRPAAFFEPLEDRTLMSTYFISNTGSDSNAGTSISAAWRSSGKVSSHHFAPGDQVLFQGGQTFNGGLGFYNDGGSASNPIIVGSYGSGKATIASGTANGAWILNTTGITIENLNFQGKPGNTSSQDGIRIENYTGGTTRSGFTITGCTITGYAEDGIDFGADASNEGLSNITITNNNIYNNIESGIASWSVGTSESNSNVLISNNQVHDNYGDGKSTVTGSGLMLQGLNNATIQYNNAYHNGAIGGSGAVGIWCYLSNNVLMQYNESDNNVALKNGDGDGFDFDSDTSNSIMQYNIAYGNSGGGFDLNQWHNNNLETGDIIRYNISQNNGRRDNYGGIEVWGKVLNAQIYNNTVYASPAPSGQDSDIRFSNNTITNLYPSNVKVANNIFVSTGGTPLVDFYAAALRGATNITFAGNVYYSYSGASNFVWGGTEYSSLTSWRGTGQEKLNGQATGTYANPMLVSPGNAAAPASLTNIASITNYALENGSPIIGSGVSLNSLFAIASPLTGGYSGKTIPGALQNLSSATSVGAAGTTTGDTGGSTSGGSTSGGSTTGSTGSVASGVVGASYLSGWDIGAPNAGKNTESGNSDIITAGGSGIKGVSDSYRFAFTTLTGNGQIIAQIASTSGTSAAAEAGLMVRSANTANAADVSLLLNSNKTASLTDRSNSGGATTTVKTIADAGDEWVKLVRNGNTFSGYISANGTSWTLVNAATVAMGSTVDIGLAVSAGAMGSLETTSYKNVSIT